MIESNIKLINPNLKTYFLKKIILFFYNRIFLNQVDFESLFDIK